MFRIGHKRHRKRENHGGTENTEDTEKHIRKYSVTLCDLCVSVVNSGKSARRA